MTLEVRMPRLLPLTMLALAALLVLKAVGLLQGAVPARAADPPAESGAPATQASAVQAPATQTPAAQTPAPQTPTTQTPAMQASAMQAPVMQASVSPAAPPPSAAPPADPPSTEAPVSAGERTLLQELRQRRAELDARDAALAQREAVAQAAEKRLAARLDELSALQRQLQALEAARRERDEANWRGLVRLYESMKPRDAATIFNDLDLPVVLPVVDRMKDAKAALILAAMLPDRARTLTAELAKLRLHDNQVAAAPEAVTPLPLAH